MQLFDFLRHLEQSLPSDTAMQGDRIGLQLQSGREEISSLLVTMEVTDAVVDEAIYNGTDCILSFHPLIFAPLTSLRDDERVGRLCSRLIRHSIALVIAHTNFDAFPRGTSVLLAEALGLSVISPLVPDPSHEGFGMGVLSIPPAPLAAQDLLQKIFDICHSPVRFTTGRKDIAEKIAIVGGSGGSFLSQALAAGADTFITADIRYHDFHRVHGDMMLIDPGHYEMEQFVAGGLLQVVHDIVQAMDTPLSIRQSSVLPNPVRYFPGTDRYFNAQQQFLTDRTLS